MADEIPGGGQGNTDAGTGTGAAEGQTDQGGGDGSGEGQTTILGGDAGAGDGENADGDAGSGDGSGDGEGGEGEEGDGDEGGAPEAYEPFTFPETFEANDELNTAFSEQAKADNLTQAQAQKYVDMAAQAVGAAVEANAAAWREVQQGWVKALNTDPEIGGARAEQAKADVALAMKKLELDQETRIWLNETGIGNHPGLVKSFAKVGKLFREDPNINLGGDAGAGSREVADIMYPNQGKEQS